MITYAREEIFSATQIAKKFGDILKKLGSKELSKAAISKNNTIEAIILPVEEYEKMKELTESKDAGLKKRRKSHFGSAKGLIVMGENFDQPLEDFKDYM